MKLEINGIYKTQTGRYLKLESIGELLYFFTLVTMDGELLQEQRNKRGHVILRNKLSYTKEIIDSFKRIK